MTIRGRWAIALLVALALSVGLNLFAAGVGVSLMRLREAAWGIDRGQGAVMARFPDEIRRGVGRGLIARRGALRDGLAALSEARAAMFEAMRAEPFDAARLSAAMAEVRARGADLQRMAHDAVAEAVADAEPEVRAAIRPPSPDDGRGRPLRRFFDGVR